MWSTLNLRISDASIDGLLSRARKVVTTAGRTEIAFEGKDFFGSESVENGNFDLLKRLHRDLWPIISDQFDFKLPVIDHSYLLVKSPGGPQTKMHQDRAYWVRKEEIASIFSVWIALDDISADNGSLHLSRQNEVGPDELSSFSTESLLEHEEVPDSDGSFPLLIPEQVASVLAKSMEPIDMEKGVAIAFDSFEPHMAGGNSTDAPRLAMKIAYGDGEGRPPEHCLIRVDQLENRF